MTIVGEKFFIELSARILLGEEFSRLEWNGEEITMFCTASGEPFSIREFNREGPTHKMMESLTDKMRSTYGDTYTVITSW